jgi:mono/diheme cytochrome c family protein
MYLLNVPKGRKQREPISCARGGSSMRIRIIVILAAALLVAGFWGVRQGYSADQGQTVFNNRCAPCHGVDGSANVPAAKLFSPPPADFNTSSFWQNMSNAKIASTIENGHGSMPALKLSSGDIRAVISYMRGTFQP